MDLLVLAGWPFILVHARRCVIYAPRVLIPCSITIALSWLVSGGEALILMWMIVFALPFVALITLVLTDHRLCEAFSAGFYVAATFSALFFMVQIWCGAEDLDFRNNFAFRLPTQFDRGFALFP
jgi:predicted membrane channel-forming protein YqfA (hemolysin III family)